MLARGVVVVDRDDVVRYVEYVPEITHEPDYDKALADGYRTPDLWKEGFQKANTEEITKVICERI